MQVAKLTIHRRCRCKDSADEYHSQGESELSKYKLQDNSSNRVNTTTTTTEPEEEPSNILNYLIGRLSEQHKTKLEHTAVTTKPREPPKTIDRESLNSINSEFEQFERHLFEKYGLPMVDYTNEQERVIREAAEAAEERVKTPTLPDTSYILTRSLYAEHKTINLDDPPIAPSVHHTSSRRSTSLEPHQSVKQPVMRNKIITALSINEIETRKSVTFEDTGENYYYLLL